MTPQNWKTLSPYSIPHALEQSVVFAKKHRQMSVNRLADYMGLPSHWIIYKHMENGRMPAVLIPPFESACGINLITRYLAHSANKVLVDIPSGRKASNRDVHRLQSSFTEAVGLLLSFYESGLGADKAKDALTGLIEDVAWHRKNVDAQVQPSFDLEVTP